jgi:general secretion pathway protein I
MRCPRQDGFTLIEVLVALVIVAVGMSVLMGALTSSAKTVSYMQDKSFAEWVALNQVTSVRVQLQNGQLPQTGKTNGDVEFANSTWHWAQEVVVSQVPGIVRIDVKVRPKGVGASSDDDNANWYATVSGIAGNALASPGTANVAWNGGTSSTTPGGGANQGTSLGGSSSTSSGSTSSGGTSGSGSNSGSGGTGSTGTGNTTNK